MPETGYRHFRVLAVVTVAVVLLTGGFLALRGINGSGSGGDGGRETGPAALSVARIGTIDDESAEITQRGGDRAGRSVPEFASRRAGDGRSTHTAEAINSDEATSEPLVQEAYIAALMAMLEKDGKDNAMLHYALAFEMAPDNPTERQNDLIQLVLDEGWDERAEELLPYLEQWDATFAKLYEGAHVGYARGIGAEMGPATPVPHFLKAQYSAKMLAVYSRYLESQGRHAEATAALEVMMSLGRDLRSPDNALVSSLIGAALQNIGVKQMSGMVESGTYRGSERQTVEFLRQAEGAHMSLQDLIDFEYQIMPGYFSKATDNPEMLKELDQNELAPFLEQLSQMQEAWNKHYEMSKGHFSRPYWDRPPLEEIEMPEGAPVANYVEVEVRMLSNASRMRQQQIDLAAQAYMAQHQVPPPDTGALVSGGYLPEVPVDPFTGQDFVYKPTENGYELYGSGPVIDKPVDPAVEYDSANGTVSEGVIRLR